MNKKPSHSLLFAALLLGQIMFGIASGAWCLQIIFATANSGGRATACAAMVGRWVSLCRSPSLVKALSLVAFQVVWILEIGMSDYIFCDSNKTNKNPHFLNLHSCYLRRQSLCKTIAGGRSPKVFIFSNEFRVCVVLRVGMKVDFAGSMECGWTGTVQSQYRIVRLSSAGLRCLGDYET